MSEMDTHYDGDDDGMFDRFLVPLSGLKKKGKYKIYALIVHSFSYIMWCVRLFLIFR